MRKPALLIPSLAVLALATLTTVPAQAGQHGRWTSVQGPHGHGYTQSRHVSRQPGAIAVSRSTQANSGAGVASSRSATWGEGAYHSGSARTFNNGASAARSTNVINNGDGSYSWDHSRTGYDGVTRSHSGTVERP